MAIRLDHGEDELNEVHDINVTPFIDVMLVLLIIFMVAAPLATVDVPVDLPSSNAQPQQRPNKPVFVTIKADHTLAIGDDPVTPGTLRPRSTPRRVPTRRNAFSCAPIVRCPMATSCRCSTFCGARATSKSPWSGLKRGAHNDTVARCRWFEDDPHARRRWSSGAAVLCGTPQLSPATCCGGRSPTGSATIHLSITLSLRQSTASRTPSRPTSRRRPRNVHQN